MTASRTVLAAAILGLSALPAGAFQVYPGCSVPGAGSGKIWYVDPVNGTTPAAGGDGSQSHPWNSLNGVISGAWGANVTVPGYSRPLLSTVAYNHITSAGRVDVADTVGNPPVNPGDTIMLMSGDYGNLQIGNGGIETVNSDFITVKAAPGQTALFATLSVGQTNKWVLQGLKIQAYSNVGVGNSYWLAVITDGGASFPATDIILDHIDVSNLNTIVGMTQAQLQNTDNGILIQGNVPLPITTNGVVQVNNAGMPYTTCIALENSHIHHTAAGVGFEANNSIMTNNEIDHFGDDAVDFGSNNVAITNNYVHDNYDRGDGNHEDAFQGRVDRIGAGVPYNAYQNVLLDSNKVVRQTDPTVPFPTYLQGVTVDDEDWTNFTVTNNSIVTHSCWGIRINSIHDSIVASNTAVDDGSSSPYVTGCTVTIAVGSVSVEGPPSSNTRVTNNLATQVWLWNEEESGMSIDHNIALAPQFGGGIVSWVQGGTTASPAIVLDNGTDANGNIATTPATPYASVFAMWNTTAMVYDLHPLPTSIAATAGTSGNGIPTVDIAGATRTAPFAAGAYDAALGLTLHCVVSPAGWAGGISCATAP